MMTKRLISIGYYGCSDRSSDVLGRLLVPACFELGTNAPEKLGGEKALATEQPKTALVKDDERYRLFPGTGVLAKAGTVQIAKQGAGELTLHFEGADLREVVKSVLSDILNVSYIMDPRVSGTITLHTQRPISMGAVLPTLETVLRMNGAVLLSEREGFFQIVPATLAGKGNLTPRLGGVGSTLPNGYGIQIVPLQYIGVADMARLLEPLGIEPGAIRMDPLRNMLILSGSEPELRHMIETIDMFDVDWIKGMSVGLFTLQNVEVMTVMSEVEKLFGDKNLGPLAGAIRLVPIERLNALLLVTPQASYLEQARLWIERLDRSGVGGGGQRLFVYQVQNGKAEQMAGLLNDILSKKSASTSAPQASLAPGLKPTEIASKEATTTSPATQNPAKKGGDSLAMTDTVKVIADKDNNALLIMANAADYESIESAIRKLDVVPRQVLIEVTIAEITLKDELRYGLEWYFTSGSKISGKLDTGASGIAQLVPGFSAVFTGKAGDIRGILNALATDSKLKVLSSPHITVTDNQKATIKVGDRVPTISQTQTAAATTTGVISTVQYIETGIMLNVTPRVNAGGLVGLEITQEVSNATSTTTSGIDSPTIQSRSAQSTVTIQSGETLVMAGLIREEQNDASSGLPGLSRIPLLGGLFGNQSSSENRTELIILITPRVMETPQDAATVTREYRSRLHGLQQLIQDVLPKGTSWVPLNAPTHMPAIELDIGR
jgi:general secretion pathway protein D